MLTTMSVAWFQKHDLPRPGAIGVFCASAGEFGGDADYTSTPLGEARLMPEMREGGMRRLGYFSNADPKDPLVAPINSSEVLAKFPPTLIFTGTRAMELSTAVYTHSQLVKLGVDAELHVRITRLGGTLPRFLLQSRRLRIAGCLRCHREVLRSSSRDEVVDGNSAFERNIAIAQVHRWSISAKA